MAGRRARPPAGPTASASSSAERSRSTTSPSSSRRPGPAPQQVADAVVVLDGDRRFPVDIDPDARLRPRGRAGPASTAEPFHAARGRAHRRSTRPSGSAGLAEVEIPGVAVDELVQPPDRHARPASARRLTDAPVAFVLSRLRADPAEPVRADPEPAIQRRLDLPAPSPCTLRGTARLHDGPDDAASTSCSAPTGPVRPRPSQHLPGSLAHGAAAAARRRPRHGVDDALRRARRTSGGRSTPATGSAVRQVELDVVADDRHSLPTRLAVSRRRRRPPSSCPAHDRARPARHDPARRRSPLERTLSRRHGPRSPSTARAPARPPTGTATARRAADRASPRSTSPAPTPSSRPTTVDTGCRDDLLTLDGDAGPGADHGRPRPTRCARDGLTVDRLRRRARSSWPPGRTTSCAVPGADDRPRPRPPRARDRRRGTAPPAPRPPRRRSTGHRRGPRARHRRRRHRRRAVLARARPEHERRLAARGRRVDGRTATVDGPHPVDGNAVGLARHARPAPGPLVVERDLGAPAGGRPRPRRSRPSRGRLPRAARRAGAAAAAGAAPRPYGPPAPGRRGRGRVAPQPARRRADRARGRALHPSGRRAPDRAGHGRVHLATALGPVHPAGARRRSPRASCSAPGPRRRHHRASAGRRASASPTSFTLMAVLLLGMEALAEATRHRTARHRRERRSSLTGAVGARRARTERRTPGRFPGDGRHRRPRSTASPPTSARTWGDNGWLDLLGDVGRTPLPIDLLGHGTADKPHDPEAYAAMEAARRSTSSPTSPVDAIGFSPRRPRAPHARLRPPRALRAARAHRRGRQPAPHRGQRPDPPRHRGRRRPHQPRRAVLRRAGPAPRRRPGGAGGLPPLAPARRSPPSGWPRSSCPVLVVIGDKDFAGPGEPLAEALPNAQLVTLRNVDHFATPEGLRLHRRRPRLPRRRPVSPS